MDGKYNIIIVGGGSAGCVLAARLSERSANHVLLIEAGPDSRNWKIEMPLAVDRLLTSDTYNWGFESEPEPWLNNRKIDHPRGRVLGGSSAINGMVYTRGNPQDYDEWESDFGCAGWRYADVLPYFMRMESSMIGDDRYRGRSGPMRVTVPEYRKNPLNVAFLEAGRALGYPVSEDPNGPQHEGFGVAEQTIYNGRRNSTAAAYLTEDVRRRPNLTILSDSLVAKVIFEGKRATGVQVRHAGKIKFYLASKEVILAAGAVSSPHLLKLSGIGPAEELREHDIPLVLDKPAVGKNLQDHPDVPIQFKCLQPVSLRKYTTTVGRIPVGLSWFLFKRGVASSNQFEVSAYIRSRAGVSKPDLKFEFFPLGVSHLNFLPYPEHAFQIHCTAESPYARGDLTLASSDPAVPPRMQFNYLSDQRDLETLRAGVRLVRELVSSPPFAQYCGAEIDPGNAVYDDSSLDDWIRHRANTAYHISCTCRMGQPGDPEAVVGPDLKVHGVEGLRIADASVMPKIVTSNLNASVIMIAERAADFCLGKEPLSPSSDAYWVHPTWQTSQR